MPVYVEIPCDRRKSNLNTVKVLSEDNLTAEPRVRTKPRSLIQHVFFLFLRLRQHPKEGLSHIDVTGGAGERRLTGSFQLDPVSMSEIHDVVPDFSFHFLASSILEHVHNAYNVLWAFGILVLVLASTANSSCRESRSDADG